MTSPAPTPTPTLGQASVSPSTFDITIPGCNEEPSDSCIGNSVYKIIFRVNLPSQDKKVVLNIILTNINTLSKTSKSIIVPDPECSCSMSCKNISGYISHIVSVTFDNLVIGNKYTGITYLNYID